MLSLAGGHRLRTKAEGCNLSDTLPGTGAMHSQEISAAPSYTGMVMASDSLSRRALIVGSMSMGVAYAMQGTAAPLTAGQVIDRIKANVGVPWREQTVDNIIAGTADLPVKGIATTMMATFDVLKRASAAGRNMVITHEPTFYSHQDSVEKLNNDETYLAKMDFINKNGMVVFHFHDHWHARRPDGINAGMVRELGWEKNANPDNPRRYKFDGIPLARFAQDIERKLKASTMRVVGDPKLPVTNVAVAWGYFSPSPAMNALTRPDVDVLIVGETREWELVEYVQDQIAAGKKKALIVIGHVASEQAGMRLCAEWLKGFVTEVPIEFVPAGEPFWTPRNPIGS
jgi:putative NIF3 family GTP cyclohydrolase 1 type 2